ncbi:MAG: hypothetical protein QXJ02_04955 [Candidatus Bathyarchaeia archaeon]
MHQKAYIFGFILVAVLTVSIFATIKWLDPVYPDKEFFFGVEFAYSGEINDLKNLVDKVKNYTNLFVIGAVEISFDQSLLNASCDYIFDAGLHFIVLFTDSRKYSYDTLLWIKNAKQKYGDKFLGVYRYDEPGGNQLDGGDSRIVENATDYTEAANRYIGNWNLHVSYYLNFSDKVFTADYALYWFNYKAGYTSVFAEFGWNHSRPLHIGLCRGAAQAFNKDWGAIITWEYTEPPYIESGEELFDDLILAYKTGAKYVVVFSYPKIGQYGILTETHFNALQTFSEYIRSNPQEHGVTRAEAAYVLPQNYGFGFRSSADKIWGLWDADALSPKVWADVNKLIAKYSPRLDIVYDDAETIDIIKTRYNKLYFWNETLK